MSTNKLHSTCSSVVFFVLPLFLSFCQFANVNHLRLYIHTDENDDATTEREASLSIIAHETIITSVNPRHLLIQILPKIFMLGAMRLNPLHRYIIQLTRYFLNETQPDYYDEDYVQVKLY